MNLDWKKIGIIVIFIASVGLFAFFIYYFFFKPLFLPSPIPANVNQPAANEGLPATININGRLFVVNANGRLPLDANVNIEITPLEQTQPTPTAQGGLTQASTFVKEAAYFSTVEASGNIIYYDAKTGKFYQVTKDGLVSVFNNQVFHNVSKVTWSEQRDKAVLEYPDGSKIVYDFKNNKQITLPKHWEEFSFAPTGGQIAFKSIAMDIENRYLAVAKNDGSQVKILEDIGGVEDQFEVNWSPNQQMVATFTKTKDHDRSEVYFIGLNNENFQVMTVAGRDFRGEWSPTGDKMVYSVYNSQNNYKPELWVADAQSNTIGNNRRRLGLETWGNKCAFATNEKIYCAVPTELPFGAGLEPNIANNIPDQIYEVNLKTGSKKLIAVPDGNHTISQIIITNDVGSLFFSDKNNNKIYKINL